MTVPVRVEPSLTEAVWLVTLGGVLTMIEIVAVSVRPPERVDLSRIVYSMLPTEPRKLASGVKVRIPVFVSLMTPFPASVWLVPNA